MQATYFIKHGGGPCFFLDPGPMRDAWSELETYLRGFADTLDERPRAVLVLSRHWEAARPTVNAGSAPALLFDYSGFPAHTYHLTWPSPGEPDLAARVLELLDAAGIQGASNSSRGWDHGVFVSLKVVFPHGDIPTVKCSLQHGLDPATHLAIGRALTQLRKERVLIIGSGQTYHNMRGFMGGGGSLDLVAEGFDAWLREAMMDGATPDRSLLAWERAAGACQAQPHEDHLLPLMVAAYSANRSPVFASDDPSKEP